MLLYYVSIIICRHEANLIQEIVGKVQREIEPMGLYVAQQPVGIESRVQGIYIAIVEHW